MAVNQYETVRLAASFDQAVNEPVSLYIENETTGQLEGPFQMIRIGAENAFYYDYIVTGTGRHLYQVRTSAPDVIIEEDAFDVRAVQVGANPPATSAVSRHLGKAFSFVQGDPMTQAIAGFGAEGSPDDISAWTFDGALDGNTVSIGSGLQRDLVNGTVSFDLDSAFTTALKQGRQDVGFTLRVAPVGADPFYLTATIEVFPPQV